MLATTGHSIQPPSAGFGVTKVTSQTLREKKWDTFSSPHTRARRSSTFKETQPHLGKWFKELFAAMAAILSTVIVVAILVHFDRKPKPKRTIISLNAVLSIFAKILEACALFPVAECKGRYLLLCTVVK